MTKSERKRKTIQMQTEFKNFKTLGNRVLLKKIKESNKLSGGLVLPDSAVGPPTRGYVLSVGADCKEVSAGDTVLFGRNAGAEVTLLGEKLHMFREDDIYGIFVE